MPPLPNVLTRPDTRPESVLLGRDYEVLNLLIPFHFRKIPRILDCTHNKGVMWKGTRWKPVRMDIDPQYELDVVADFRALPFADHSFDLLVFDPPHLPHAQDSKTTDIDWVTRYGCNGHSAGRSGDNVSPLFLPFLQEAKRVLREGRLVFAKIADMVHNHRYQWQHLDFVLACREVGMTPCDVLIKRDPTSGHLKSGQWKNMHHLRRCHTYWIIVRNSGKCE